MQIAGRPAKIKTQKLKNLTIKAKINTLKSVIITAHNVPFIIAEKNPFSLIKKPHVLFTKQYAGNKNSILIF